MLFSNKIVAQSAPVISYTPSTNAYSTGTAITPLSPANSGGAVSSTFGYGSPASLTAGTGGWNKPRGIAINASDNVYITNQGTFFIYKYDISGNLLSSITTSGIILTGIVSTSTGDLYALSSTTGNIYKISGDVFSSTVITTISGATGNNNIAIDAANNLYITTSTGVSKYTIGGSPTTLISTHVNAPSGVAVDAAGNIYVLNFGVSTTDGSLEKYNSSGVWQSTLVSGLAKPYGLAVDGSGNFFVSETGSSVISSYTPSGAALLSDISYLAYGLALDSRGVLYASTGPVGTSANRYAPNGGYYINKTLPAGLSFDNTTGIISGTPTATSASTTYKITGYNSSGSSSANVTISCATTAPSITYTPSTEVFQLNQTVNYAPVNTGSPTTGYTISPAVSHGLAFSTSTGAITGTLTSTFSATNYTVTATNGTGHSTVTINLSCISSAPALSYSPSSYSYPVNVAITALNPTNTGGVVSTWSHTSGTLPAGLSFSTTTGAITGTPTAITSATAYTIKGTNSQGNSSATVTIAVVANPPVISYATPQSYLVNAAITTLNPTNTGGPVTAWSVSPALPAGLSLSTSTGAITGTPTASAAAANYTVTATNTVSGNGTTIINITCYKLFTWIGSTSTDWNTASNWTGGMPGSGDQAVFNSNYVNLPTVSTPATVGSILFGTPTGSLQNTLTVNSTLTVAGDITYQSDAQSFRNAAVTFSGTGTISAANLNIIANTTVTAGNPYTQTVTSSVNNLNLSGNLSLTSTQPSADAYNATFNFTGGTLTVGNISTSNAVGNTATISIAPTSILNLAGSGTFAGLSANGTNTLTASAPTIGYTGNNNQTVYTDASIANSTLTSGISYTNIAFSGTGIKTALTGNLNVTGSFTNSMVSNGTTNYVNLSSPTVNFTGGAQALAGGTGTGTTFYNVAISGAGTKTMSGKFSIASSGVLTMTGTSTTILSAGSGLLTLNSDASGSATVAQLNGPTITGTVNVQRYITGGSLTYRGYRSLSSPVTDPTSPTLTPYYNLSFLKGSGTYLTGAAGGGFDATGGATILLYNQSFTPNNVSLTTGVFRAVTAINNATHAYTIGTVDGNFNLSVGNGYFLFFRGNNSTNISATPNSLTLNMSGTLNQGQYTVNDWYTVVPTSQLGYTGTGSTGTNSAVRGFNLVGNPYPSSIDWHTNFGNTTTTSGICCSTSLDGSIYVYNPTTKNYSIYTNNSATTGTATGSTGGSNIIPSGQAFFVRATTTGAKLIFNESAKVSSQPATLLLNALPNPIVDHHLRLQLFKDTINKDETVIIFNATAASAYAENEDALYLQGAGEVNLSNMTSDNVAVGLNQQPFPTKVQTIGLNVIAASDGNYQLKMTEVSNIPNLFDVWLKDAYMNDSLDIKHNPNYSFNLTHSDASSVSPQRFTLVIRQNTAYAYHLLSFNGAEVKGGAQLTWTTENENDFTSFILQRSTDGGKTFTALATTMSNGSGSYSYLDTSPAPGPDEYRLQITDINGAVSYSNIITLLYSSSTVAVSVSNISIYPNPANDVINVAIIPTGTMAATYTINIINSNGNLLKTYTSQQAVWQNNVSGLAPGVYLVKVINNTNGTVLGTDKFIKL